MMRRLAANPSLDPSNDTSIDPVLDLLKALELYPKRAEPLMQLSKHSEWLRDHWCASLVSPKPSVGLLGLLGRGPCPRSTPPHTMHSMPDHV